MIIYSVGIDKYKLTGIFPRWFSGQEKRPLLWTAAFTSYWHLVEKYLVIYC